jgi:murein DD-endopeptidase MepM/ murein hydrolase activator NlpD
VVSALLTVGVLTTLLLSSLSDTIGDKQNQLNGLNNQIIGQKTALGRLVAQQQALQAQVNALDAQLAHLAQQMQQETAKLEELQRQIDETNQRLAAKEAELAEHIREFGTRVRFMYKSGEVNGFELILSAVNFNDLLNRIIFFKDIEREDRRQVTILQQERAAIEALKADLEAKHAQQAQVVATIKAQQQQTEQLRQREAAAEAQVAAIAAQFQQQLNDMMAQRAALEAQIAALQAESLRARSSGAWIWPIDGVITQGFGCTSYAFEPYDPNCPQKHFHSGIDIANDYGTPVHAADGGIVHNYATACSWNPSMLCGYGRYVVIVHAGGFISLYGHLSGWAIADGTQVAKDTVIGYEGTSGNSTGPHLHFEIDVAGTPVNPLAYLP